MSVNARKCALLTSVTFDESIYSTLEKFAASVFFRIGEICCFCFFPLVFPENVRREDTGPNSLG
jgi:hypothetical protein